MMLAAFSRYSTIILAVLAMSYGLPAGFDKVFGQKAGDPLLFFSPLQKQFIYRESLGGHSFNYMNEEGTSYSRTEFEAQLPFLYYKNLEKKKQLPFTIDGRSFDKKTIKAGKQGFEIKSRHLDGHHPQIDLYPLFNNDPEVAIMPFPEDVFRFTGQAMEFIKADFNRIDRELTDGFTGTLKEQGFIFPATVIGGKTTNLKPFDEGFFVRDSSGQVFHIKRILNQPEIVKTAIDPALDIQDIIVSENRRREFYGTIVTTRGDLYLISYENYRLIPLPVEEYNPRTMDFKLLVNSLYRTATVSDSKAVQGIAMDTTYQPLRRYELKKLDHTGTLVRFSRDLLFPFQLRLATPYRGQADIRLHLGGLWSVAGVLLALALFLLLSRRKSQQPMNRADLVPVLLAGFFGLVAISLIKKE